jgi:hypothetical protein
MGVRRSCPSLLTKGDTISKSKWERKVGELLKTDQFVYTHKCPDIFDRRHPYAGKARIDWLALDRQGHGWLIEVKYLDRKKSMLFNLFNKKDGISAGQRGELQDFGQAGYALLAVGHSGTNALYIFEWPWVEQLVAGLESQFNDDNEHEIHLDLTGASRVIRYPRGRVEEEFRWSQYPFPFSTTHLAPRPSMLPIARTSETYSGKSYLMGSYPSILRPRDLIHTPPERASGSLSLSVEDKPTS